MALRGNFSKLSRSAGEIKRYRMYKRIVPVCASLLAILLILIYIISLLFSKYGSFTININNINDQKNYALSLSESDSFDVYQTRLNANAVKNITNMCKKDLPDDLNDNGGQHNGENYLAYTFYLKNSGTLTCNYKYSLVITKYTGGIDSIVRVRLYFNKDYYKAQTGETNESGEYTDFAKPKTGGNGEAENDARCNEGNDLYQTNFYADNIITTGIVNDFNPDDMARITVVVWIEGDDPDCDDSKLGGEFKIDMDFEIIEPEKNTTSGT